MNDIEPIFISFFFNQIIDLIRVINCIRMNAIEKEDCLSIMKKKKEVRS